MVKQAIIVRDDLDMEKGKLSAQVAHASIKVFLDRILNIEKNMVINATEEMKYWATKSFTKVVLKVNSEKELYDYVIKAKKMNIPFSIIVDNGFKGFPKNKTTTCVAIGPDLNEIIDEITKELELL